MEVGKLFCASKAGVLLGVVARLAASIVSAKASVVAITSRRYSPLPPPRRSLRPLARATHGKRKIRELFQRCENFGVRLGYGQQKRRREWRLKFNFRLCQCAITGL